MYIPLLGHWYWSQKNGLIWVNRKGEVIVRGYKQTSDRYQALWRPVLRYVQPPSEVRSILLLGLAGGGIVPILEEIFPNGAITAIEHDDRMVAIAREHWKGRTRFPATIVSDAYEALQRLDQRFDCIIIDLFLGMTPPRFVEQRGFWELIQRRLAPSGAVILNIAGASYRGTAADAMFPSSKTKRVYDNTFIVYAS